MKYSPTDIFGGMDLRTRRDALTALAFALAALTLFILTLCLGNTFYPPTKVAAVLFGAPVPGASFTIRELRFPRALTGLLAGFAFGMGGSVFQTLLRNPLASPDTIGINAGSGAAAVFFILFLKAPASAVFSAAIAAGLLTAFAVHLLGEKGGHSPFRLILCGIGFQAGFGSVISYMLTRASPYDVSAALRWLSGSLNGATITSPVPIAISLALGVPVILGLSRTVSVLQLGDQTARGLGASPFRDRLILMGGAVLMLSCAAAVTGPIASVSFLAGPIARALSRTGRPSPAAAGFAGAALVLAADLAGQFAFGTRFPVGVVTGLVGAPYLLFLMARMNRSGDLE